jgi:hypothetical protein
MATVKNILRLKKTAKGTDPFYQWDVESNGKSGTFYTDPEGQNIWQEGVATENTHIYNATVIGQPQKKYGINVKASVDDIRKQIQGFADSGFFTQYLK